jgi:transcription termination/antitermination protein NusG
MIGMTRTAWYVVRTLVGHENKVKFAIEKRAEAKGLTDRIFQVLIPTEQEVRTKGGKKQTITRRVFPGYVLVEMILDDETWTLIRTTPGVTGFVESGGKPVPLSPEEVEEIKRSILGEQGAPAHRLLARRHRARDRRRVRRLQRQSGKRRRRTQ